MADEKSRPPIVLVVRAVIANQAGEILLVKRSPNNQWGTGKWEFPGGKLETGKDIFQTLQKEVGEEVGLTINPKIKSFHVESWVLDSGKYQGLPYVAIFGTTGLTEGKVKLSSEHDAYVWCNPEKITNYPLTKATYQAWQTLKKQPKMV